jgi:hypothetical protein
MLYCYTVITATAQVLESDTHFTFKMECNVCDSCQCQFVSDSCQCQFVSASLSQTSQLCCLMTIFSFIITGSLVPAWLQLWIVWCVYRVLYTKHYIWCSVFMGCPYFSYHKHHRFPKCHWQNDYCNVGAVCIVWHRRWILNLVYKTVMFKRVKPFVQKVIYNAACNDWPWCATVPASNVTPIIHTLQVKINRLTEKYLCVMWNSCDKWWVWGFMWFFVTGLVILCHWVSDCVTGLVILCHWVSDSVPLG